jgi:hypothetical protein
MVIAPHSFPAFLRARLFPNSILLMQISFAFSCPFALIMVRKSRSASLRFEVILNQRSGRARPGISRKVGIKAAGHGLNEELMARTNGNGSLTKSKTPSAKKLSPQQKIAQRAYEIYLERNGAPGNPLEDWVRAERELLEKSRKTAKKTASVAA